jgi:hypothetical protein
VADIVVSYKSEERGRAGNVVALLEAAGYDVWWDGALKLGQSYDTVIGDQLDAARCVLVIWSKASVASDWVRGEAKIADEQGKLIPVATDDARILPPFNMRHTFSLREWNGLPNHPQWVELIREISRTAPLKSPSLSVDDYVKTAISRNGHNVHKLKAKDTSGRWAYYFVLVPPDRETQFIRAIEGSGIIDLQDFGMVLASSYGETPTDEIREYLKARYGWTV